MNETVKPVYWIGSSRRDLRAMPQDVRRGFGKALYAAQQGESDPAAKPLKGFGGTRVMEIVERFRTDAFRAVYTAFRRRDLRAARISEEIETRPDNAETEY